MGQAGSITAKAMIHPLLRIFTQWEEERINELFLRARGDLSDTFALRFGEFQHLLNRELVSFLLARDIFNDIFDTDRNLIVDKFEVVSVAILMSNEYPEEGGVLVQALRLQRKGLHYDQ